MSINQYIYVDLIQLIELINKLKKQGHNPDKLKITLWHGVYRVEILENDEQLTEMDTKYVEQEWEG